MKNTQNVKSGIEKARQISPPQTNNSGFLFHNRKSNIMIKIISCGFMLRKNTTLVYEYKKIILRPQLDLQLFQYLHISEV